MILVMSNWWIRFEVTITTVCSNYWGHNYYHRW